jgi:hypothetical protein
LINIFAKSLDPDYANKLDAEPEPLNSFNGDAAQAGRFQNRPAKLPITNIIIQAHNKT